MVGGIVVVAVVLALISGGVFDSSHHHGSKTKTADGTTTTTPAASTTTASTTPPTTVPVASVKPLALSALEKFLKPVTPPPTSLACNAPDKSTGSSSTTTTTTPAKGRAVSIVPAPAGVGFPKLNGSSPRYTSFTAAPPFCINVNDTYTATMKTTAGTIVIRLLPKYAPVTVNNFVFLAGYHYFDGTVFHRVIPGFVDQGGDPTATGTGGPGYKFNDELPKSTKAYDAGALAMANSGANTNGSQFFLVVGDGGQGLQAASYSMYGQVISGLDVANKINAGGTSGGTPKTYYKIDSVSIAVTPGTASSPTTTTKTSSTTTKTSTTS